jgi:hypothetical protein
MRIAICVPHYGDVKARFFQSVGNMIAATMRAKINYRGAATTPKIKIFIMGTAVLDMNRCVLVTRAREWGADYVLFCDTDMTFPDDALLRLLAADQPIVGCNYVRRGDARPIGAKVGQSAEEEWERFGAASGVERAAYLGLGLALISAAIFDRLERPWFRTTIGDDGVVTLGEDGYFFDACRRAGVPVFVENDLSRDVGHIAERELKLEVRNNADTIRPASGTG